jgi:NDP-sugar pyrophosphorylase family protein
MELRGTPMLEQIIRSASRAGIERFTIIVGYRSDLIRQWFAQCRLDRSQFGLSKTAITTNRTAFQRSKRKTPSMAISCS